MIQFEQTFIITSILISNRKFFNKINYILFSTKTKKFYSSQKGIFKKSKLNYLSLEKNLAVPIQNKESNIELLGKKTKRDNGSDERKK